MKTALSASDKKMLDKTTAAGNGTPLHPANLFKSSKFLLIAGSISFVVMVAGVSWYYYRQAMAPKQSAPASESQTNATAPIENETENKVATTELEPTAPATQIPAPPKNNISFPSVLLGDSPDSDRDGLTDTEEELFKTNASIPDSDSDGYSDSHEIYNLYNPAGKEPMKLSESGLVKEFVNPVFSYKVYYPESWAVGNVDESYREMLFSTLSGENIELRVFDKKDGQTFGDWFSEWAPGEKYGDLQEFAGAFKENGLRRNDFLTYYFTDDKYIYAFVYHTTDSATVNYRTVIKMMARGFRTLGNSVNITVPAAESEKPVTSENL